MEKRTLMKVTRAGDRQEKKKRLQHMERREWAGRRRMGTGRARFEWEYKDEEVEVLRRFVARELSRHDSKD